VKKKKQETTTQQSIHARKSAYKAAKDGNLPLESKTEFFDDDIPLLKR